MKDCKKKGFKRANPIGCTSRVVTNGFILNLDPSYKPEGHWVAVCIDSKGDKSVEEPSEQAMRGFNWLLKR